MTTQSQNQVGSCPHWLVMVVSVMATAFALLGIL